MNERVDPDDMFTLTKEEGAREKECVVSDDEGGRGKKLVQNMQSYVGEMIGKARDQYQSGSLGVQKDRVKGMFSNIYSKVNFSELKISSMTS